MAGRDVVLDKVIEGDGKTAPRRGNIVTVNYIGYTLTEDLKMDRKFDDTQKRGKPFKFRVDCGEVIPGWDRGVMMMTKGERSKIMMPPELAYGDRGFPGLIEADRWICFEVELVNVQ